MSQKLISNENLQPSDIPLSSAEWQEIAQFALTFDGYKANGSFDACSKIANVRRHETINDLRTCLFFEQRRWRHFGEAPDEKGMEYIRSLLEQIRLKLFLHKV
jgi:hypothetical protein